MAISPNKDTAIKDWTIYKIVSPTNRVYIGITSNFKSRMESYRNCDKRLYRQTFVYNSIRKYGYVSHSTEIVENFTSNHDYAKEREIDWIKTLRSNKSRYPENNGLNLTDGGDGTKGYKPSKEAIEKNRLSKIGKKASIETKLKMSKAKIGMKMNFTHYTTEFLKNLSERSSLLIGKKKSPENLRKHLQMVIDKFAKPIMQYSLNGEFIKEFPMIILAVKELKISRPSISRVLSGQYNQSKGFIFKYK